MRGMELTPQSDFGSDQVRSQELEDLEFPTLSDLESPFRAPVPEPLARPEDRLLLLGVGVAATATVGGSLLMWALGW